MDRPRKIAFIDTETTGLSHLNRAWEIAVILRETDQIDTSVLSEAEPRQVPGEVAETEHLFQVEYRPSTLPDGTEPQALEIGGWRERGFSLPGMNYRESLVDQGVLTAYGPEWTIARSVNRLLKGATLVGVGTHYDAETLGRMFLRHGLDWQPWHYDIQDCKTLTRGYLRARNDAGHDYDIWGSSEQLAAAIGVEPPSDEERHTALGDARWARRWFDAL